MKRLPLVLEDEPVTLTRRQQVFVDNLLADPNQSIKNAAIAAGCNPDTVYVVASQMYSSPRIKAEIKRRTAKALKEFEIEGERILQELALVATSNLLDFGDVTEEGSFKVNLRKMKSKLQAGAIQEIYIEGDKVRIRLHPKLEALEKLMRFYYPNASKVEGEAKPTVAMLDQIINSITINVKDKEQVTIQGQGQ